MAATLARPLSPTRAFRTTQAGGSSPVGRRRAWHLRGSRDAGHPEPDCADAAGGASGHPRPPGSAPPCRRPMSRQCACACPTAWFTTRWAPWTSTAWSGTRLAVPVHAGHLLASSDLAAQTTTLPPGRTRLAIAWDPPAGAAADVNAGDTVIVYSTARQGAATATVVIDHARVVRVVRPQADRFVGHWLVRHCRRRALDLSGSGP